MKVVALDIETNGTNPKIHKVTAVSLSFDDETTELYDMYYPEHLTLLKNRVDELNSSGFTFIGHFMKFDYRFLMEAGIILNRIYCTFINEQILNNGLKVPLDLRSVVNRYFGVILNKDEVRTSFNALMPITEKQKSYIHGDTKYLIPLFKEQKKLIDKPVLFIDTWYNSTKIFYLESRFLPIMVGIEKRGIRIDKQRLIRYVNAWTFLVNKTIQNLNKELIRLSGIYPQIMVMRLKNVVYKKITKDNQPIIDRKEWHEPLVIQDLFVGRVANMNYNSNQHIQDLFTRVGIPIPKNEANKESVDEERLNEYIKNTPESPLYKFIVLLLELRKRQGSIKKYGESFIDSLEKVGEDYYTTTNFKQMVETGRMSSNKFKWKTLRVNSKKDYSIKLFSESEDISEEILEKGEYGLNMQNIPATNFRSCFIAPKDYMWLSIDYAGIEARIAAELSNEPLLIKSFTENLDIHCYMGSAVYSVIFDQEITITSDSKQYFEFKGKKYNHKNDLRKDCKNGLYGYIYFAKAPRMYSIYQRFIDHAIPVNNLFSTSHLRNELSKKILKVYDQKLPVLHDYLVKMSQHAKEVGYTIHNKMGRIRHLKGGYIEGKAANSPIQGTNADIIKIAMVNMQDQFDLWKDQYGIDVAYHGVPVHDETNTMVHKDYVDIVVPRVKEIMVKAGEVFVKKVPIEVEANLKKYWKH